MDARARVGRFGVWFRGAPPSGLAAALEEAGWSALWLGGSPAGDLRLAEEQLASTGRLTLATGIVNIWASDAADVARAYARVEDRHPGRFLLGVGVGHREATEAYRSPFESLSGYVDTLLAEGVPPGSLVLAALGPRVLRLAAERTAGAHPYLVTPVHTKLAREVLGPGPLLAPEQHVVVDADRDRARALARDALAYYLRLSNYTNNFRRLGFLDADLADGGSDELVDALVAHGPHDVVARRLREHLDAGADHVAVNLVLHDGEDPAETLRDLAGALGL